jgi:hypothetical protein
MSAAALSAAAFGVAEAAPPSGAAHGSAPPSAAADEAADAQDAANSSSTVSEVTVTGHPPPEYGAVVGDIKPELQLSPSDIQSFGVSTVTELLSELAPETRSDRGRSSEAPVILVNGRRMSRTSQWRRSSGSTSCPRRSRSNTATPPISGW